MEACKGKFQPPCVCKIFEKAARGAGYGTWGKFFWACFGVSLVLRRCGAACFGKEKRGGVGENAAHVCVLLYCVSWSIL